jgi:4-carboxymuconolactone decarboxylase
MAPEHNPRALEAADRLFPGHGRKRLQMLEELDTEFRRLFEDFAYAGLYSREVLDHKTRELCAVACLTALNRLGSLESHIRASLVMGATRQEVQEVIFQVCAYGGMPVTLAALDLMRKVYADIDRESSSRG